PGIVTGTTVRIPMPEPTPRDKGVTLEAILYRPASDGPHAVLLFNHGSTGGGNIALSMTMRPSRQAQFFVERGFAVLAPMRRGRGDSDGVHQEYEGTCEPDVLGAGLARAIEDVDATMAYLRAQPWADPCAGFKTCRHSGEPSDVDSPSMSAMFFVVSSLVSLRA